MSSRPVQVVVALAVIAGLFLTASWYWSDEQKIARRLQRIQKLVAKSPAESDLAGLAAARSLAEIFAEPFTVTVDPEGYSTSDRRTLMSGIHSFRERSSTLIMEITGRQTFLDENRDGANSFFTVRFLTGLSDLAAADQYDVRIHWRKEDGGWMIGDVRVAGLE